MKKKLSKALMLIAILAIAICATFPVFATEENANDAVPEQIFKHPRPDVGKPTEVAVGFFLRDLEELDAERETYEISAYLTLTWKDARLAFDPSKEESKIRVYSPEAIWTPDPFFVNAMGTPSMEEVEVMVLPDGTAEYRARVDGTFFSSFNLRRYPFDSQTLRVELRSEDYDESQVAFVVDNEATGKHANSSLVEWHIGSVAASTSVVSNHGVPEKLDKIFHGSQYLFEIPVARKPLFYLWSVLLPLALFVIMSWAVVWSKTFEGATVVASIPMLAYVAFNIVIIIESPRVGYMTFLNACITAGYVLITISIMEMMYRHILERGNRTRTVELVARSVRWLLPAFSMALICWLIFDFLH